MHRHGKAISAASLALALLAIVVTCPMAVAQDASQTKTTTTTPTKPGGAVSSSYAACAPGNPIGGVIVKGAVNQTGDAAAGCAPPPSPDKSIREEGVRAVSAPVQPEAASREEKRTYTGGRRSDAAPAAGVKAPATPARSISEKGVR